MKKFVSLLIVVVGVFLIGAYLWSFRGVTSQKDSQLPIVATFYPLAEFARAVGGERVTVSTLVPAGSEPHDYEPTARQIAALHTSRLFLLNGAGFERWSEKIVPELIHKGIAVVDMSTTVTKFPSTQGGDHLNPHFWLDPVLAIKEVQKIEEALSSLDPAHAAEYKRNATEYITQLNSLDNHISQKLGTCTKRDIITAHDAFGYYAQRYNLSIVPIAGLSPDEEPSPQRMAEISNFAKTHSIRYIFFESLVSPRLSDTIAKEIGAKTLVFNPLEGLTEDEIARGENYFTIQEENLNNLVVALDCTV